jgi:SAM-dependent methyltransferase
VSANLVDLHRSWEALGAADPMWAVLTDPAKRGGGWDPAAFLASGEHEIRTVFERLAGVGVNAAELSRALDFGCGAGRLTQALAWRCERADGVDIAASMLELAERLGPPGNARFHQNTAADLALFADGSFDFVYSSIVLQHMNPGLGLGYIAEFVRVLAPGGVLVFQIPDRCEATSPTPRQRVAVMRRDLALGTRLRQRKLRIERQPPLWEMEMHAIPEARLRATFARLRCEVLDVAYTNSTAEDFNGRLRYLGEPPASGWVSRQWTVVKARG